VGAADCALDAIRNSRQISWDDGNTSQNLTMFVTIALSIELTLPVLRTTIYAAFDPTKPLYVALALKLTPLSFDHSGYNNLPSPRHLWETT
jgi:hypothetical protein